MKERMISYLKYMDDLLKNPPENADWSSIISQHLIQLQFFQHERLIHLIVTITFAIMQVLMLLIVLNQFSIGTLLLFLLIFVLLVPYIAHYYRLENGVQYMYRQYDKAMLLAAKQAPGKNAITPYV